MKKIIIITGSLGLIGLTCAKEFIKNGYIVVGIDNDSRKLFFGENSSVEDNFFQEFENEKNYTHEWLDVSDKDGMRNLFKKFNNDILAVVHCAAQPSHDWSYKDPILDFNINAFSTLNILELIRLECPDAFFFYMSTNKVYGDNPNKIKLDDCGLRYDHFNKYINGIPESFNIDSCIHSIFGVNKLYSDLITQEYGKNLGIKTCIMRCGCLTGGKHKGAELHGFLSYLTKCIKEGIHYEIHGYQGKQVRDNIHSYDVWSFINEVLNGPPIYGQVFNLGGGRENSTSVLEAVSALEAITEKKLSYSISNKNRTGDHKWYISDLTKISVMYPEWRKKYKLIDIYIDLIK